MLAEPTYSQNPRTPSPVSSNKLVMQCPKSIVVNPLHYLERYTGKAHATNASSYGQSDSWTSEKHQGHGDVSTGQDFHGISQSLHQQSKPWVGQDPSQQEPFLNLTDDIFMSYQPPPPHSSMPPPRLSHLSMPPPPPPGGQSLVNMGIPHTREKVRDIFKLASMARQPLCLELEEGKAPVVSQTHRTHSIRQATANWSAKDESKCTHMPSSHAQRCGLGMECDECEWGRQYLGDMYCGAGCRGHGTLPQPHTHPRHHYSSH